MQHCVTTTPDPGQSSAAAEPLRNILEGALARGLIRPEDEAEAESLDAELSPLDVLGQPAPDTAPETVARLLAAGPAADMALDTIAPLFEPGDVIELQAINPAQRGQSVSLSGCLDKEEERIALAAFIHQRIGRWSLYYGVNPRPASFAGTGRAAANDDVVARQNVVLDLDDKEAPGVDPGWVRTLDELRALGPSYVLRSGNGWQVALPVKRLERADISRGSEALADVFRRLGADRTSDLRRVMRLPFTVNLPNEAKVRRGAVPRLALPEGPTVPGTARPVEALCEALVGVATRLGLPGRGADVAAPARAGASRTTASGEPKTGQPAPSLELLALLLKHLPNEPGGPFDNRDEWVQVGHAVVGAARAGGIEGEARDLWLEWSARNGGGPSEAGLFYDTCRDTHTGWGTLRRWLEQTNPAGHGTVARAEARVAFAREAAENFAALSSTPFGPAGGLASGVIPPRRWLYGSVATATFLSMLVAAGGSGKSALMTVRALAMATGRTLLEGEKPHRPLTVWVHNAEDPADEQRRRYAAAMRHYGLTDADLGGRLILTSGRDHKLTLATSGRDGAKIEPGVIEWLEGALLAHGVDVLILDPLGATHGLPENDNSAVNLLAGELRLLAHRTGAAILLVHHSSKAAAMNMDAAGAGPARGASAWVDAARLVEQIVGMTKEEASRDYGLPECDRWRYFRVENGKANLAPKSAAKWSRLVSVSLQNGTPDYPEGDVLGVVERWTPPANLATPAELADVQDALNARAARGELPPLANPGSPDWIGFLAGAALGKDIGPPGVKVDALSPEQQDARATIKGKVDRWLASGGLKRCDFKDAQYKDKKGVEPGTPAVPPRPDEPDLATQLGIPSELVELSDKAA